MDKTTDYYMIAEETTDHLRKLRDAHQIGSDIREQYRQYAAGIMRMARFVLAAKQTLESDADDATVRRRLVEMVTKTLFD